jgi:rod shape-determining protein MreC
MHDRAVRRRRAVLAALVAVSLILLTAYFGESAGGGLHSVQRGAMEVLSPIQEGASRALKPFRDLFGWFGDTLDAKSERDKLKRERDALRRENAKLLVAQRDYSQLDQLRDMNAAVGGGEQEPVLARVIVRSPSAWFSTVEINKGSSDGIREGQPVINGEGLVGKVKAVSDGNAVVMLLTDQDFGVSAMVAESSEPGTIEPNVGSPGDLRLELVARAERVRRGDRVVTAGTVSSRYQSLFPRAIPIGQVSRVEAGEGELDRVIHVKPAANLRRLEVVEVLTNPSTEALRAQTSP